MENITIRVGSLRDYRALEGFHYRAGRPATVVRVLVAQSRGGEVDSGKWTMDTWVGASRPRSHAMSGRSISTPTGMSTVHCPLSTVPIGVLVVSMPTLNGPWRAAAWPDLATSDKRLSASRLNASLRCISRVIVDPRWRGLGIATGLVRHYLNAPLTPRTEAVAAMGRVSHFFRAAGMREVPVPPSARDARLLRALAAAGIQPWECVDVERTAARIRQLPLPEGGGRGMGCSDLNFELSTLNFSPSFLERSLRTWADASRSTRRFAHAPLELVIEQAAMKIAAPRSAYLADSPPPPSGRRVAVVTGGRGEVVGLP